MEHPDAVAAWNPVNSPLGRFPQRPQDKQLNSAKECSGQPSGQAHWPVLLPQLSLLSLQLSSPPWNSLWTRSMECYIVPSSGEARVCWGNNQS